MKKLLSLIVLMIACGGLFGYEVRAERESAIYNVNEPITFVATDRKYEGDIIWLLKRDGMPDEKGKGKMENGRWELTTSLDKPGFALLKVTFVNKRFQPYDYYGGAGAEPEKITSGYEPEDFDEFWARKVKEVYDIPLKSTYIEREYARGTGVLAYEVTIDCGDTPVRGMLSLPEKATPKSLNAILSLHGAGVFPAQFSTEVAKKNNALHLIINAHGISNLEKPDFYEKLQAGELRGYTRKGIEDPENAYFVKMFQRVAKALQYLKSRPEWNGKVLIVRGGSQGGAQALAGAALDKDVTFCGAAVPGLGDLNRAEMGRIPALWPGFPRYNQDGQIEHPMVRETAGYLDVANHAKRITCDTYLSVGYIDLLCPPTSIYAIYNNLKHKKKIYADPLSGHSGANIGIAAGATKLP